MQIPCEYLHDVTNAHLCHINEWMFLPSPFIVFKVPQEKIKRNYLVKIKHTYQRMMSFFSKIGLYIPPRYASPIGKYQRNPSTADGLHKSKLFYLTREGPIQVLTGLNVAYVRCSSGKRFRNSASSLSYDDQYMLQLYIHIWNVNPYVFVH